MAYERFVDPVSGAAYFHCYETGATVWEEPSHAQLDEEKPSSELEESISEKAASEVEDQGGFSNVAGLTNGSRSNEDAILSSTSMDGNNKTNNGGSSSSGSSSSRSSSSSSSENAQRREEHSRGAPESSIWHAAKDPASNDVYYFNALTGETSWELPDVHFVASLPETPSAPSAPGVTASNPTPDSLPAAAASSSSSSPSFTAAPALTPLGIAPDHHKSFQERRAAEAAAALPNLAARAAFAAAVANGQSPAEAAQEAAKAAARASAKASAQASAQGVPSSSPPAAGPTRDPAAAAAWAHTSQARATAAAAAARGGDGREGAALNTPIAPAAAPLAVSNSNHNQGQSASGDADKTTCTSPLLNVWQECIDPASGHPYYYHAKQGLTQWAPPAEWLAHTVQAALPPPSSSSSSDGKLPPQYADYTTTVTFERNRGFAGASNHWQRNGIATDREDRQMGIFADHHSIQAQMLAAAEKKRAAAHELPQWAESKDWKSFNKERKEKKRKGAIQSLLAEPED